VILNESIHWISALRGTKFPQAFKACKERGSSAKRNASIKNSEPRIVSGYIKEIALAPATVLLV
jgi:hypothetical protein